MYTISRAAEHVGISAATLRAWERRYGVVAPTRTGGAYRVYSADDLRVLQAMKGLVDDGWSPAFAAQEALREAQVDTHDQQLDEQQSDDHTALPADRQTRAEAIGEQFVTAAASFDSHGLEELLDQMFSDQRFEAAAQNRLFPALEALGDGWASGRVSVSAEHLASHAVSRRLAAAYDAAGNSGTGGRVVLGLGPGSRHELGLLAFAVAARRQGLRTDYLGADVPVADWLSACSDRGVAAIVMSVHSDRDMTAAADVVAEVGRGRPDILIATGGLAQGSAPEEAVRLGNDIEIGARTLARAVASHPAARTSR
jgi:DNA-binding transcriptional MerR regulator/methylmalonyl-CoA mutase cobalamin-binding subunit